MIKITQYVGLSLLLLGYSTIAIAEVSLVDERVKGELATSEKPFVITPHKANYLLPVTYQTRTNALPFESKYPDEDFTIDNLEAKFQISFKFPIMYNVFGDNGHLFFAYTNQSYWQVYNEDASSPFRETNHEPEVFMLFNNDWKIGGFTNSFLGIGAVHQSNGQTNQLSRSWNRIYGSAVFDRGPFALGLRVWWRLPEDEKENINVAKGDDNPDINRYMGNFELTGVYGLNEHRFTMLLRNNLRDTNRGAVELTWSYPIIGTLRIYTQYFNGYGESLIDYNHHNQRVGIGIALNDIL
ncbi:MULTISPECIES: phospholipase A [Shewanella]|uniref:Phospholipase A1 n=2 Tax=Gammaproteobacteria TaxID=1236 RepID=A0A3N4DS92_9GAMM|nr:phospholipase A [Shewanella psychromarinicola]AZG33623.1 phospholipase [Shewanella psychromarinicola]MCL1082115.1 phospholipase A [Shewanella psychromarinicola]RPA27956.1 phospholipase [Shewanella psychromarinicola]